MRQAAIGAGHEAVSLPRHAKRAGLVPLADRPLPLAIFI
jgi:hypothetical protein